MSRFSILKSGKEISCPQCGRPTRILINGVCPECFRRENPLATVPEKISLKVCRICGAVDVPSGRWIRRDFEEVVKTVLKGEVEKRGEVKAVDIVYDGGDYAKVRVYGRAHDALPHDYWEEYMVKVERKSAVCPACVKLISKKEEARIQVRALHRALTLAEKKMIKSIAESSLTRSWEKGRAAQPIRVEEGEQGIDIVLASREAARELVSALSSKMFFDVLETSKDVGIDESGRGKRRVTYRLLLPPFREGDIVEYKDKVYLIKRISKGRVSLFSLGNLSETSLGMTKRAYRDVKTLAGLKDLEEGMVVSIEPPYVMVMSLKNFESFEVKLSGGFDSLTEGSRVRVFRHRGKTYIVPL